MPFKTRSLFTLKVVLLPRKINESWKLFKLSKVLLCSKWQISKMLAKWLEEKNNQSAQAREEENTNHKIQFAAKMIWSYLSDKIETVPIWTPFKGLLFGIIKVFSTIGWKQLMRLLKQPLNLIYLDMNKLKAELQDIVLIMQICHGNIFLCP